MPNQLSDNARTTDNTKAGAQSGADNSHLNLVSLVGESGKTPAQTIGHMSQENSQMALAAQGFPTLDLIHSSAGKESNGSGMMSGIESEIKDGASHVGSIVATGMKYTTPVGLIDHFAGTNISGAIGDMAQGVANEAVNDPKGLLKDAAIGAAIGVGTVVTGGGLEVGMAIGAGVIAGSELYKNSGNGVSGEVNGAVKDAVGVGSSVAQFGKDLGTVAGNGNVSNEDAAKAKQGLEKAGAFVAQAIASGAGTAAGAELAGIAGRLASSGIDSAVAPNQALDSAASNDAAPKPANVEEVKPAISEEEAVKQKAIQDSISGNQALFGEAAQRDAVTANVKQSYNVRFTKVTEPKAITTIESAKTGSTEMAKPGQFIATRLNADGTPNIEGGIENSWPVNQESILKAYDTTPEQLASSNEIVAPTKVGAKPVHMMKLDNPLTINTPWGPQSGEPGAYLANYDYDPVTKTPGQNWAIVSEESYKATYRDVTK